MHSSRSVRDGEGVVLAAETEKMARVTNMSGLGEGFSENVSRHVCRWHVHQVECARASVFADVVKPGVDVLGALAVDRVVRQGDAALVVLAERCARELLHKKNRQEDGRARSFHGQLWMLP